MLVLLTVSNYIIMKHVIKRVKSVITVGSPISVLPVNFLSNSY